jgi:GT2 family glycosyltransferase
MTISSPFLAEVMISFLIKTYNEEKHIAACIESVIIAASNLPNPYEIIVADSVSADRTVQIAASYPVKIVQFKNPAERGCGAGVQLGYQHARGNLVFLLDGDMTLQPEFLPVALRALRDDKKLAGVAGLMKEVAIRNTFDEMRVISGAASTVGDEPWLNGGGLYRREAIDSAGGYAANRNLMGWEEAELGMRLRSAGWQLRRVAVVAVHHDGHVTDTQQLLMKHWKSRRLMSNGILLKSALTKPWIFKVLILLAHPLAVVISWLVMLFLLAVPGGGQKSEQVFAVGLLWGLLLVLLSLKKKSVWRALRSVAIWHFHAAALLYGLFLPTIQPTVPIASTEVSDLPPLLDAPGT